MQYIPNNGSRYPWVGVLPTYGARRPFLIKNIKVVLNLQYHIFYQENICRAEIWRAFDYKSISKSFIHWLLRYEPRFLGWASCPMLPYYGGIYAGVYGSIPGFLMAWTGQQPGALRRLHRYDGILRFRHQKGFKYMYHNCWQLVTNATHYIIWLWSISSFILAPGTSH